MKNNNSRKNTLKTTGKLFRLLVDTQKKNNKNSQVLPCVLLVGLLVCLII